MLVLSDNGSEHVFLELSDFPFASLLSSEACQYLKKTLEQDFEKHVKRKQHLALALDRMKKKCVA